MEMNVDSVNRSLEYFLRKAQEQDLLLSQMVALLEGKEAQLKEKDEQNAKLQEKHDLLLANIEELMDKISGLRGNLKKYKKDRQKLEEQLAEVLSSGRLESSDRVSKRRR